MATMYSGLGGPAGYGENVFSTSPKAAGSNDDGSVQVDVTSVFGPGGINFYGTNYTSIYINSNGVISFGAPETGWRTTNYTGETTPNLAPFWADVNINNGGEIYWDVDPANGTVTITWDGVAPYSGTGNNSFQVQLTNLGGGDFQVEYIYQDIQWSGGGSGDVADAGLTDGGANDTELDGSGNATQVLDYENTDFGTGGGPGTFTTSFIGGTPVTPDGIVSGTAGADVIDASYAGDPEGEVVDGGDGTGAAGNEDTIHAGGGNDTVFAGAENDTVLGEGGDDTIDGGSGDDILYGDNGPTIAGGTPAALQWSLAGADEADVSGGFTQGTGDVDVTVAFTTTATTDQITIESSQSAYVETGEPFSPSSNLYMRGNGAGDVATMTVDFAAAGGASVTDEVQNVQFRINDIDSSTWQDILTVTATDAAGNPVTVNFTPAGNDTVSGNTITAGTGNDQQTDANGSVLIDIPGPVASIQIQYTNGGTSALAAWISDMHFETVPLIEPGGNDTLTGGTGADMMYGEGGDDTFYVAEGDTAEGGDGDDTFNLVDLGEAGSSTITIVGGEGGETAGDTLNFGGLIGNLSDITYTNTDDANGGLSGTATLSDGTIVNFSEIENLIVCFVAGTRIRTPHGEAAVETLKEGDLVVTADHGPQPVRWVGKRTVVGAGSMMPVRFAPGAIGNARPLSVSPQHRMVLSHPIAELMFGSREVFVPAKALIDDRAVTQSPVGEVTYVHVLLDRHAVLFAEGAATESFFPARQALCALDAAAREDLLRQRPDLAEDIDSYGRTARPCLTFRETRALLTALGPRPLDHSQAA